VSIRGYKCIPLNWVVILSQLSLCSFAAITIFSSPRIIFDSPKYDFGTVIGQDEITHEYVLWNRGDSPVKISSIKNCCGTKSSIMPMEILPGSNAVCTTVFTTRNRYGLQDKQILIASNDRKNPYFELKMVGTLLKPVDCTPRYIRLGTLFPDSEIVQTISATNLLDKAVVLESVTSRVKGIAAEIMDVRDRSWTIQLSSSKPMDVGKINGQIQLGFSSGTVSVPVIGTVKPVIKVVPERIQFSSRSTNVTDRLVMIRSEDGRAFDVLSARLENVEGSVEIKKLADNQWRLKIIISPSKIQLGGKLTVETTCPLQPVIEIPFSVK
jgi:hypothetical protein